MDIWNSISFSLQDSTVITGVITSLLAAFLFQLIVLLVGWLKSYYRESRPLRKLWGLSDESVKNNLVFCIGSQKSDEACSLTGVSLLSSLSNITSVLSRAFSEIDYSEIYTYKTFPEKYTHKNLILIGNSSNNQLIYKLIEVLADKYSNFPLTNTHQQVASLVWNVFNQVQWEDISYSSGRLSKKYTSLTVDQREKVQDKILTHKLCITLDKTFVVKEFEVPVGFIIKVDNPWNGEYENQSKVFCILSETESGLFCVSKYLKYSYKNESLQSDNYVAMIKASYKADNSDYTFGEKILFFKKLHENAVVVEELNN